MKSISTIDPRMTFDFLKNASEDQYFERKSIGIEKLKPTKLANEIIGMLNADGGVIVLGVSDKGVIEDLNAYPCDILDGYRKVSFDYIKPPAHVELEEVVLETGELLFFYHIDQDYERVFSRSDPSNEDVYLRVGDANK